MRFELAKQFIYKGYNCFIVNSSGGWRNGYVEIPKDSLFFGKTFSDKLPIKKDILKDAKMGKRSPISLMCYAFDDGDNLQLDMLFDVHGGITYGRSKLEPVSKENSWFLGFDCNHAGDGKDESIMDNVQLEFNREYNTNMSDDIIRDEKYVEQELFNLVDEIIKYNNLYNNK